MPAVTRSLRSITSRLESLHPLYGLRPVPQTVVDCSLHLSTLPLALRVTLPGAFQQLTFFAIAHTFATRLFRCALPYSIVSIFSCVVDVKLLIY